MPKPPTGSSLSPSTNSGIASRIRPASLLLVTFTCLALGLLGYFEWRDGRPFSYDDAWYVETGLRMFNALSEGRWLQFLYEYAGSFGGTKAPLISVAPLPFFFLFGKQLDPTFAVNGIFLILSSSFLYALVRRWYPPVVGLLSVVVFQTFPAVAGLSRWYLTEYGLAALVVVFLYYLASSDDLRSPRVNLALGVTLGLGLLTKVIFPAFVAGPVLVTWLARRGHSPTPPAARSTGSLQAVAIFATGSPLLFIGLVGAFIASSWYVLNLDTVLAFVWANIFGNVAGDYSPPDLSSWLRQLPHESISLYYAMALPVFVLAALIVQWKRGELCWRRRHWFLLAWFAPAAFALLSAHTNSVRFAAPALAVLAIVLARGMQVTAAAISRRQAVQTAILVVALAVPLMGFVRVNAGAPGFAEGLYQNTYWFHPPDQQGQWNQHLILERLRELAPAAPANSYVIVGVEHPYLNANLLNYLKQRDGSPFAFDGFGYAESSAEQAIRHVNDRKARFILMAEGFDESELPAFLNRVNRDVQRLLDSGSLPFRNRTSVQLTERILLHVYEREE